MDKYYNGAKLMIGSAGIVLAIIIGVVFSLGGQATVLLMIMLYVMGLSVGPRIVFEFGNPYLKIYMAAGPVGISFVKLSIKIFRADGEITSQELAKLKKYMKKEFGKEIGNAAELFIKWPKRKDENILELCKPLVNMKSAQRVSMMYQLFAMAASGGQYKDEEEEVLKRIGKYLHIGRKRFYYIKSAVIKNSEDTQSERKSTSGGGNRFYQKFFAPATNPYFVLGIANNSSNEEIKKAYRELVKKYHPDLSMHKSEQYQKEIKEKVQDVNEAYNTLKRIRGIK